MDDTLLSLILTWILYLELSTAQKTAALCVCVIPIIYKSCDCRQLDDNWLGLAAHEISSQQWQTHWNPAKRRKTAEAGSVMQALSVCSSEVRKSMAGKQRQWKWSSSLLHASQTKFHTHACTLSGIYRETAATFTVELCRHRPSPDEPNKSRWQDVGPVVAKSERLFGQPKNGTTAKERHGLCKPWKAKPQMLTVSLVHNFHACILTSSCCLESSHSDAVS